MLGVFFFFNFYWSIVALQCCVGFYCAAKCISYTYTYISSFLAEFPVLYSKFSLVIYFIFVCVCVCVRACTHVLTQSLLTLCDSMDCIMHGSSVYGLLQARILEWFAISFSRGSSLPRDHTLVSYVSCIGRQILYH